MTSLHQHSPSGSAVPPASIDPITLEILWQRMISIMDEVDQIIVRTTFSTILRESRDFACILTDAHGFSLCQSVLSTANFASIYPRTAKVLLERFPLDTLAAGDVLATNDPWIGTGHLPDYILLTPVFWRDRVVACIGTVSHMSDVGGHPGEIEGDDIFSEGLRMLPFKLFEGGKENPVAFDIIGANCRVPDLLLGDLRAMAGAAQIGAERCREFLADYNMDDLDTLAQSILNRSDAFMRQQIHALPDGSYEYGLDIDGYIEEVHLHVTVEIRDDTVSVDYTGTSPQSRHGAINVPFSSTLATSMYPFKCALAPNMPNNEGLFRSIRVSAPSGSILNVDFPAAVKARAKTTNNLNQVLFGALWPIFGEHVQACNGAIWPFVLSGTDAEFGHFLIDMLPHGGRGALPTMDGMLPISYPNNSTITPCEIIEREAPIRFLKKELRPDSGGPGEFRGGLGQVITFQHVGSDPIIFNLTPDRLTTLPLGLNGGLPGRIGEVYINGERTYRFPPIKLLPDDVVELHIAGGGGFGPVERRADHQILRDLAFGYITAQSVEKDYGMEGVAGKEQRVGP